MICPCKSLQKRGVVYLLILSLWFSWGLTAIFAESHYSQDLWAKAHPIDLDELITVVPKDSIPAILDPQFEKGTGAERQMEADEPVMGLSINGESKAYSTYILSAHEIVNDTIGGIPIAITW